MKEDFNIDELEDMVSMTTKVIDHPKYGMCLERVATSIVHNTLYHPHDLPSFELLDLKTKRPFFQLWTDKKGNGAVRPDNQAGEICSHPSEAYKVWFDENGDEKWKAVATGEIKHPQTGEVLDFIYANPPELHMMAYLNDIDESNAGTPPEI